MTLPRFQFPLINQGMRFSGARLSDRRHAAGAKHERRNRRSGIRHGRAQLIRERAHALAHIVVAEARVADLDTGPAGLLLHGQRALCRAEQSLTPPTWGRL